MVSTSKKILILMLSLFVALFNACSNNNPSNAENKTELNKTTSNNQLVRNQNWIQLSKIWKKLNNIEHVIDSGNISEGYKQLEKISNGFDKYIKNLYSDKLINNDEKDFLMMTINQRVGYLEYKLGFVKCYDMSQLGFEIIKHRDSLEKQYNILEKLFKENKISTETFKLTKQKINEDMAFIEKNNYSSEGKEYNENFTKLLIYLNQ